MTRTGIPYLDLTYNPGGFGCSGNCRKCWARRLARRVGRNIGCPDCAAFRVHLHPERFGQPAGRKKAATIGVQFTGELFDPTRSAEDIQAVLSSIRHSPQHAYVFLTQHPEIMAGPEAMAGEVEWRRPNWFCGITIRHQDHLERRMASLMRFSQKIWLSVEPMTGPIDLWVHLPRLSGVVIGCDNQATAPHARWRWIRKVVFDCRRADVPVFVKQIRKARSGRLLRNPADFPQDLQVRQVGWPLAGQPAGHDHYTPPQ